jgi:CheY-like chemotaxis protein
MDSDQKTILCVDDEQGQLRLRRLVFERAGFCFVGAQNATEALKLFGEKKFDAVILDYWLPGMRGIALAEALKRLQRDVPIVMLSGLAPLPGETAIVNAWLLKGFVPPDELLSVVSRVIKSLVRAKSQEAD